MTDTEKRELVAAVITQLKAEGTNTAESPIMASPSGMNYLMGYNAENRIARITPVNLTKALDENILKETTRATEAETALGERITAETERTNGIANNIYDSLSDETNRATEAENDIKNKATHYGTLGFSTYADRVNFYGKSVDGSNTISRNIPAATTENAGVMTASDKTKLENVGLLESKLLNGTIIVQLAEIAKAVESGAITLDMLDETLQNANTIVNSLDTYYGGRPLSAYQGTILKNLIDDITKTGGTIDTRIATAIRNVIDNAPENFDTLKEIADWIAANGDVSQLVASIQKNADDISAEAQRAKDAENAIDKKVTDEVSRATKRENELEEQINNIEGVKSVTITPSATDVTLKVNEKEAALPVATTETAGVMTAEDKKKLDVNDAVLSSVVTYNVVNYSDLMDWDITCNNKESTTNYISSVQKNNDGSINFIPNVGGANIPIAVHIGTPKFGETVNITLRNLVKLNCPAIYTGTTSTALGTKVISLTDNNGVWSAKFKATGNTLYLYLSVSWSADQTSPAVLGNCEINCIDSKIIDTTSYYGYAPISYSSGYVATGDTGTIVNISNITASSVFRFAILPTRQGLKYSIRGVGGGNPRLWAFVDSSNVVITSASRSHKAEDEIIVAPTDAALLIVNFNTSEDYGSQDYELACVPLYDGTKTISTSVERLERKVDSLKSTVLEPTGVGYLLTNVGIGNYVDFTVDSASPNWRYYISNVREGQTLRLSNCRGGANSRLWAFLDSESKLISISAASETVNNIPVDIQVPTGAAKVVINNSVEHKPSPEFILFSNDALDIRISSLEKDVELLKQGTTNSFNILIFGNSYSYRSAAQGDANLLRLLDSVGVNSFLCVVGNGGASFQSNYTRYTNNEKNSYRWEGDAVTGVVDKASEPMTYIEALTYKPWDYIIFHQASKYSGNIESFTPYLQNLIDVAKIYCDNENVKFGLMQTWAYADIDGAYPTTSTTEPIYNNQEDMYNAICATYKNALKEFEDISFLIPAGTAIQNARGTILGENYNDFAAGESDSSHISSYGTLITSLLYLNKIYDGNIKLSQVSNTYSSLMTDEEFAIAITCAKNAIKMPFKVI